MKILFLTDNFPPEVNAPATRTYEHCREWVKLGAKVTVITCFPNFPYGKVYEGYKNKLVTKEVIDGIHVIRVWSYMTKNSGFIRRTLDFISFAISSFTMGLFLSFDVIIATSPQFFTAIAGRHLSFWKRKPWVMEVRDLWPEQVLASTNMKHNLIIKFFEWEEFRCYKKAKLIISVTESFVDFIEKKGIKRDKIHVIRNGINTDICFFKNKDNELIKKYSLYNKKVVGYLGTHGLSQNLNFIVDSIKTINNNYKNKEIYFIFIGEGSERQKVINLANDYGITNIEFIKQIQKHEVPKYLSIFDIGLVPLRNSKLYETVIPSKIFELAASHIPILLGTRGESKKIIQEYDVGIAYEPENKKDFINKLFQLMEEKKINDNNFEKFIDDFRREKFAKLMLEKVTRIV